jgi:hypothetical protein
MSAGEVAGNFDARLKWGGLLNFGPYGLMRSNNESSDKPNHPKSARKMKFVHNFNSGRLIPDLYNLFSTKLLETRAGRPNQF